MCKKAKRQVYLKKSLLDSYDRSLEKEATCLLAFYLPFFFFFEGGGGGGGYNPK